MKCPLPITVFILLVLTCHMTSTRSVDDSKDSMTEFLRQKRDVSGDWHQELDQAIASYRTELEAYHQTHPEFNVHQHLYPIILQLVQTYVGDAARKRRQEKADFLASKLARIPADFPAEEEEDADKDMPDFVKRRKSNVREMIDAKKEFVQSKIEERLEKLQAPAEDSPPEIRPPSGTTTPPDVPDVETSEAEQPKEARIAGLIQQLKAKIRGEVMAKKAFVQSKVQTKLAIISFLLQNTTTDTSEQDQEVNNEPIHTLVSDAEIVPENVENSIETANEPIQTLVSNDEIVPVSGEDSTDTANNEPVQTLVPDAEIVSPSVENSIDTAIDDAAIDKISVPNNTNVAVVQGLLQELLTEFQTDVENVRSARQEFDTALSEVVEAAGQLDNLSSTAENSTDSFTSSLLMEDFQFKLGDMISAKQNFVSQKMALREQVIERLNNMSLADQNLTGSVLSYVEVLDRLLDASAEPPEWLQELVGQTVANAEVIPDNSEFISDLTGLQLALVSDAAPGVAQSRDGGGDGSTVTTVVVVACLVVAAAVVAVGVVVLRGRRQRHSYTSIPSSSDPRP